MRIYFDNVIDSGVKRGDLHPPEELEAARALDADPSLEAVTSRQSWREQERTRDDTTRQLLKDARPEVPTVPDDHRVLGMAHYQDRFGGMMSMPLVSDITDRALYDALVAAGLKTDDAQHLMYAVTNGCERFVTMDTKDILPIRHQLEPLCRGLKIARPTELVAERTNAG